MLPNLPAIETRHGRIEVGSLVASLITSLQGEVSAIFWNGYRYCLSLTGGTQGDAEQFRLLSKPSFGPGFNYVNPHAQQVLSAPFEVLLSGEGDRIYFAQTAEQAIALLAATIGLADQEAEVAVLKRAVEAGPVQELRWRGQAVGHVVGGLGYVSTTQQRQAPRFQVGSRVCFFSPHSVCTVRGVALFKDRLNYGQYEWHYFYEQALGNHPPMGESHTSAAPEPAV